MGNLSKKFTATAVAAAAVNVVDVLTT